MQKIDLVSEIEELLSHEDLSDRALAKGAGVDTEVVRRLRKGIRPIEGLRLETVQKTLN